MEMLKKKSNKVKILTLHEKADPLEWRGNREPHHTTVGTVIDATDRLAKAWRSMSPKSSFCQMVVSMHGRVLPLEDAVQLEPWKTSFSWLHGFGWSSSWPSIVWWLMPVHIANCCRRPEASSEAALRFARSAEKSISTCVGEEIRLDRI